VFVFSGVLIIGVAATTGEKEQGSFALLLLNRVSRGAIALAKTAFVMVAGLMNSIASALGFLIGCVLIARMELTSKHLGGGDFVTSLGASAPHPIGSGSLISSFVVFLLSLAVLSSLFSAIIVTIGLRATTVKEANSYCMPIFLLILLAVIPTIFSSGRVETLGFLVPILNTSYCLKGILDGTLTAAHQVICLASNLVLVVFFINRVKRLFASEAILYSAA